ncbi:MAG TPA: isoprenylcysteine carboxylmethyltransferase family protein [Pirellulaceae bacterium]|nr:isoprenylcysteine carboxylmethyltransferase family protein [Pirellulaceae bacterium]
MQRTFFLAYGIACYGLFLATFAYLLAFVGNLFLPRSIDQGPSSGVLVAAIVDVALILLFGLQHSLMARAWFKAWWTQWIPQPIERSTYLLASSLVTAVLVGFWQPIDIILWDVTQPALRYCLWGLFFAGWLLVPAVSLMINHFDLFGLRQVWLHWQGKELAPLAFRTPLLYARVRHPLYVGWAIAFWATPTMTVGHALFAALMTSYMLIAVIYEERDLLAHFGQQYREYQKAVPMFLPRWRTTESPTRTKETEVAAGHYSSK